MNTPTWHPLDEGWGVGERIELGEVLVAWVDPHSDPDVDQNWAGPSSWTVGYEDNGEPCEPLAHGDADTREGARRDALAAAHGLLTLALEAGRAAATACAR